MTLEEAIQSNEQSELSYRYRMHHLPSKEAKKLCLQIATNYHQQAEWLKELAERRKQPEIIYCKDCRFSIPVGCAIFCKSWSRYTAHKGYCHQGAERRTDGSV